MMSHTPTEQVVSEQAVSNQNLSSQAPYFELHTSASRFSAQTVLEASLNHFKEESASITAALTEGLQRYKRAAQAQVTLKSSATPSNGI